MVLILACARLIGDLGVTAAEMGDVEADRQSDELKLETHSSPSVSEKQQVSPPSEALIPEQKTAELDQTLESHKSKAIVPSEASQKVKAPQTVEASQKVGESPVIQDLDMSPLDTEQNNQHKPLPPTQSSSGLQDAVEKTSPASVQTSPAPARSDAHPVSPAVSQSLQSFRVDPSTLPQKSPDMAASTVNWARHSSTLPPDDAIAAPRLSSRHARLLVQALRYIPSGVRTGETFYETTAPLRYYRRVPQGDAIAWNQPMRSKAFPQGKPTSGYVFISSLFGKRPNPFGRGTEFHNGIDLVGAKGIPVLATAGGHVTSSRRGSGYGIHVVVDHGSGYQTLYAHLSKRRVRKNQTVKRGQIIGYLGNTGRSTGPHLHYSVYLNRQAVDPKPYIFK